LGVDGGGGACEGGDSLAVVAMVAEMNHPLGDGGGVGGCDGRVVGGGGKGG